LYVVFPLLGNLGLREDRSDRTDRHAGIAVDTLLGMDEELVLVLIEARDRANLHAGAIFGPDTRLGDDVGHLFLRLQKFLYILHTPCSAGKQKPPPLVK
jgi:hypothetical protein